MLFSLFLDETLLKREAKHALRVLIHKILDEFLEVVLWIVNFFRCWNNIS